MKSKDPFGMESLVFWNAALLTGFLLMISLASVAPVFIPALSSLSNNTPAQVH